VHPMSAQKLREAAITNSKAPQKMVKILFFMFVPSEPPLTLNRGETP